MEGSEAKKNLNLFVWTSGFHNPLVHTDFNMFVDEWTSANESPGDSYCHNIDFLDV